MSKKRIDAVRKSMRQENLDAMIVTHLDHVRYLTGYTGTNGLLVIGAANAQFFTDFRYADQARKQVKGARVTVVDKGDLVASLKEFSRLNKKNRRYGYSADHLTVAALNRLQESLRDSLLVRSDSVLAELGWVKEPEEIKHIRAAAAISDTGFERILNIIRPGVRERELAAELEYQMTMLGSEKPAFETIVASGPRSAMPHGVASVRKLKRGDFITFDFGATVEGYVSDMTRTVVLGKASPRQKKVYNIVLKAQKAGIRKVKAGVAAVDVDGVCRKIISKAGYGKQFGHGTGHGIGYFVHLGPRLAPNSKDRLKANQVVTVEPGIYISGWGGVRIEDDVVVTRAGYQVLNKAEKKLLEL
jgi:Xaa-Pro aminopeptidase